MQIAQDGEHPAFQVGMKLVRRGQGADNRILHEIVCAVAALGKKPGKSTQARRSFSSTLLVAWIAVVIVEILWDHDPWR